MERGHLQFLMAVHNCTETSMYKIQSQLWNDMFSSSNISTGESLNHISRVIETLYQENRV